MKCLGCCKMEVSELQSRVRGLAEALVSRGGLGGMDRLWFLIER